MKQPLPFGKYYLLERINVGGMAEVFKAKAFGVEGFERLLAIKRILPNIAEDEEFIEMFIDEAKIAVQLTHANIAQIFDLGKVDDSYFIALEYIHGKDLRAIFDRARKLAEPLPIPMACFIIMKICEGLDYAHNKRDAHGREMNLVHRDISPQNILVSYEGEVKLIDFGIAKAANKASKTQAGILKGKFGYMSPEQVRGLPLDRKSDIFSLGIVLYELLTGERLFLGESDFSTLEKVRNVEIMPPTTYNHRVSEELEHIVLRALEREPDERYHTAIDLHDDLQRFMYATGQFFSRKDLAAYMKTAFAEELTEENAKLEEFKRLSLPAPVANEIRGTKPAVGLNAVPGGRGSPMTSIPPPPAPAAASGGFFDVDVLSSSEPMEVSDLEIVESSESGIVLDSDAIVYDPATGEVDIGSVRPQSGQPPANVSFPPRPPMLDARSSPVPTQDFSDPDNMPTIVQSTTGEQPVFRPAGTGPQNAFRPSGSGQQQQFRGSGTGQQPGYTQSQQLAAAGMPLTPSSDRIPYFAEQYAMPAKSSGSGKVVLVLVLAIVLLLGAGGVVGYMFLMTGDTLGTLAIRATPEEVEVLIGDERVDYPEGSKPTFELEEGTYEVTLLAEGYAPFKKVVKVKAGKTEVVRADLESVGAGGGSLTLLRATTVPANATITVDGEPFDEATPTIIPGLEPGEHLVEFSLPGYRPVRKEFDLKEGETLPLRVVLEPLSVTLKVDSDPQGRVVVTGGEWAAKDFGTTPATVSGIDIKTEYTIEVSATGHAKWTATRSFDGTEAEVPIFATLEKVHGGTTPRPPRPRTASPKTASPRTTSPRTAKPKTAKPAVAGAKGILKVNTKPWTKVFVDGKEVGRTPILSHELSAGPHKITLVCTDESVCSHLTERRKTVNVRIPADGSFFVKEALK